VKQCYKIAFLTSVLLAALNSIAQDKNPEVENVTTLTILNPGLKHEQKIGTLQTVCVHAYITTLRSASYSSTAGFDAGFYLDPALNLQGRHYYNAARRAAKGKVITRNSMNYVSVLVKTEISKQNLASGYFAANRRRPIVTTGLVWGFQRNYNNHISLDVNFGAGYLFAKDRVYINDGVEKINASGFTTVGQVSLGFWLNKR
jgi:hypothetical protein